MVETRFRAPFEFSVRSDRVSSVKSPQRGLPILRFTEGDSVEEEYPYM